MQDSFSSRWGWLRLAAVLLAVAPGVRATPQLVRGPYLQNATPTSIVIVWRTEGEPEPEVRYGVAGINGLRPATNSELVVRRGLSGASSDVYQVECRIEGLQSDTTYRYSVWDGDAVLAGGSEDFYFTTSPAPGTNHRLRFWAVGDSGTGKKDQADAFAAVLHLNTYDEDRTPDGAMADWIRRDLDAVDQADWIIAFFHHPPYSKGSHDSDTERRMVEVRERSASHPH